MCVVLREWRMHGEHIACWSAYVTFTMLHYKVQSASATGDYLCAEAELGEHFYPATIFHTCIPIQRVRADQSTVCYKYMMLQPLTDGVPLKTCAC